MNALSYIPTTAKLRAALELRDRLALCVDLFVLFLCYPLYHVRRLMPVALLLYKALRDYRISAGGLVFVMPGNCPPENTSLNWDYEPEVRRLVESFTEGVFVDCGAGIGLYTLIASRALGKRGKVVALEPDKAFFEHLRASVGANGLDNISVLEVAAWSESGDMSLHGNPLLRFQSSLKADQLQAGFDDAPRRSRTVELDAVVPSGSPVLLKLDIEGSEPEAMVGAMNTLLRKDVVVIFEALSAEALLRARRIIEPLGYEVVRLSDRDYLARRP